MRIKTPEQAAKIVCAAARLFATHRFHEVAAHGGHCRGRGSRARGRCTATSRTRKNCTSTCSIGRRRTPQTHRRRPRRCRRAAPARERMIGAILAYFDANPYLFDLLSHAESRQQTGTLATWQNLRCEQLQRTLEILEEGRLRGAVGHPRRGDAGADPAGRAACGHASGRRPPGRRTWPARRGGFLHGADRSRPRRLRFAKRQAVGRLDGLVRGVTKKG